MPHLFVPAQHLLVLVWCSLLHESRRVAPDAVGEGCRFLVIFLHYRYIYLPHPVLHPGGQHICFVLHCSCQPPRLANKRVYLATGHVAKTNMYVMFVIG
jgi:hypothetical protein